MRDISIFGTSSDSGKSTFTFVIAKIFQDAGFSVAPFKSQNVSNNSKVCDDGGEIAIAQDFQAEVLGLKSSHHFNPVLLKIEGRNRSQIILNGYVQKSVEPREYYKNIDTLKPAVKRSFEHLKENYDLVVAEGAGSPVELNLMQKDLSNIFIAEEFDTKIILVADIERGGVFASVYGTYLLLPSQLQKNVVGVIINKFHGDITLFEDGVKIIEEEFKIPVLGVVPYMPFNLGFEDTQSLINYKQNSQNAKIKVAIINFPHMSNFNDFEPLIADAEVAVEFISSVQNLQIFDLIILPGTKSTIADLQWLKKSGLFEKIESCSCKIYGVCGGYQMMFERISDVKCVENNDAISESGFGFFEGEITFEEEKIVKKGSYEAFDMVLEGFEIHNGISKEHSIFCEKGRLSGSFLHGVFDNDSFREFIFKDYEYVGFDFKEYKKNKINDFVQSVKEHLDVQRILDSVR